MLIQLKKIKKKFVHDEVVTKALRGIDLNINKGEFVSIMGPSGSGKSTLMHIIGLLDHPSAGVYKFQGRNIKDYTEDELAGLRNYEMGFIFQQFNLLARTTVYDNVKLPLMYRDQQFFKEEINIDERVKEVVDSVGLSHRLYHYSNQLSGGETQRVAIARALVNKPAIVFADEPTGNLDSKTGQQVMEIIQGLNDQGQTVILVTHETYTAEFAKRIVRLKDGLIVSDTKVKKRRIAQNGDSLIK